MPSLKKFRKMAGLPSTVRRWSDAADMVKEGQKALVDTQRGAQMKWPSNVNRKEAEAAGLKPEDFRYLHWPVSNVRIDGSSIRHAAFWYVCDMPKDTPVCTQYDANGDRIPDPVGMCLQSVDFSLYDADTGDKLDRKPTLLDPLTGEAWGKPSDGSALWHRLTPGTSIKVKLVAMPDFFYLGEDGGMKGHYANTNDGQFKGAQVESPTFTLIMDHDGNVTIG